MTDPFSMPLSVLIFVTISAFLSATAVWVDDRSASGALILFAVFLGLMAVAGMIVEATRYLEAR